MEFKNKRPDWCPHVDCAWKIIIQEKICGGELPKPTEHNGDFNTHRLCIDTRETGHGIFDLMINRTDMYAFDRIFKRLRT